MSNNSGFLSSGFYQDWDDVYNYTLSDFGSAMVPGDLIFVDYTGDGLIDNEDTVPLFSPSSSLKSYAASFGLTYKGFGVSAMLNGVFDMYKQLDSKYLWATDTINSDPSFYMPNNETLNYWTPTRTDASSPGLHANSHTHNSKSSSYTRANASFLRLRNVEFKYNFGPMLKKKGSFIQNLEVYVSGQNLFTWSGLDDSIDPEAKSLVVYPISKKYNFGVRFTM